MSTSTVRFIIGFVLIVHGIGYSMAFFPALDIFSTEKWHTRSWVFSGLNDTASCVIIVILFGIVLIGFIAAGLSVFNWLVPHDLWQKLAIVSAIIGLVALAIFWNAFASLFPNKIGAIAVNVVVLWTLLGTNTLSQMVAEV